MKNSADFGECYSASVDNTLLDLQNSSYPTQPHSIIANYCTRHSGASSTRKSASQPKKYLIKNKRRSNPIRCLVVMKLAHSVFMVHAGRGIMGNQGTISRKQGRKMYVFLHISVLISNLVTKHIQYAE